METANKNKCSLFTGLITALLAALILILFGKSVHAAGLLKPKDAPDSTISIKSHDVRVIINNGYTRTEVDQVFTNSGDRDLDGTYTFPLPRQASLSELSIWIDGQEVIGEVLEKKKAREIYVKEQQAGKETAIAEKDEYKTFNISVSPIRAQQDTRVRLVYYQPISIDLNVGRYVYPLKEGGVDDERIAFWSVDGTVQESFSFELVLKSAYPVKDLRLPGYMQKATIARIGTSENESATGEQYHVQLSEPEGGSLEEDIILYYRLDDSVPARVELVPYKEASAPKGTFMLTITPGASLAKISDGTDWVFILDTSGSMAGSKIETLANGVAKAIGKMNQNDRFRIITFSDNANDFSLGFKNATPDNIQRELKQIKTLQANGGTNLHAGLSMGLDDSMIDMERTTSVILVTDGVANIGRTAQSDFLTLIKENDVRLFTFIIDNSANTPLLDKMAKISGGFAMDISSRDDIYGRFLQAKGKVLYQALHDVEVDFQGGEIEQVTPENIGSLYRGQQLVLFGKYNKPEPARIALKAKISGQEHQWETTAILPNEEINNPEIERLWALSTITEIKSRIDEAGESPALSDKIVDLGEHYSLVTDYTSMVVADDATFEKRGITRKNQDRVQRERQAQQQRAQIPAYNYQIDNSTDNQMFKNSRSPGVGSGPVGPWLLVIVAGGILFVRRKR